MSGSISDNLLSIATILHNGCPSAVVKFPGNCGREEIFQIAHATAIDVVENSYSHEHFMKHLFHEMLHESLVSLS